MNDTGPVVKSLADLIRDPDNLQPPTPIVPRLAWPERLTLLAAPEKSGKSTLVGQAVAAMVAPTPVEFLDEIPARGPVLMLALDEPLRDTVRRLYGYGARAGVFFLDTRPTVPDLEAIIVKRGIRLLVIDTLTELAAGAVNDLNAASQLQGILKPLRDVLQRTSAAGILLHHANKSTGRYRDSSQIGAGVDVIVEMSTPDPAGRPTVRRCKSRGRVRVEDFALVYEDGYYHIDQGELPLEIRVYRVVEGNPGISKRALRAKVIGRAGDIDKALNDLLAKRAIADEGDNRGARYYTSATPEKSLEVADPVNTPDTPKTAWDKGGTRCVSQQEIRDTVRDTPPDTPTGSPESAETAWDTPRTRSPGRIQSLPCPGGSPPVGGGNTPGGTPPAGHTTAETVSGTEDGDAVPNAVGVGPGLEEPEAEYLDCLARGDAWEPPELETNP